MLQRLVLALGLTLATLPAMALDLSVVDANNKLVGKAFSNDKILVEVAKDVWVQVGAQQAGFQVLTPALYYTSTNCTGTAYIAAADLPPTGGVEATGTYNPVATIDAPNLPYSTISYNSFSNSGTCTANSSGSIYAGAEVQLSASFTAPFVTK